jgi:hypothetical protein
MSKAFMKNQAGLIFLLFLLSAGSYMVSDTAWGLPEFSSDMVVMNNKAIAKLVVGTLNPDATGVEEDLRSADIIIGAIKDSFNTTVGGEIFKFTYSLEDLDGDLDTASLGSNVGDDFSRTDTSTGGFRRDDYDDKWLVTDISNFGSEGVIPLSGNWMISESNPNNGGDYGIWFDGDDSGDIEKKTDWPIYNDVKILEWERNSITIMPALRLGNMKTLSGMVIKIHGKSYAVTKYDDATREVELSMVTVKTVLSSSAVQDIIETSLSIPESNYRIGLRGLTSEVSGPKGDFALIVDNDIIDFQHRSSDTDPPLAVGKELRLSSDLIIIPTLIDTANGFVDLAIGHENDQIILRDGVTDVLGYAEVVVGDSDNGWTDELRFEDKAIKIEKGKFKRLGETENFFFYNDNGEIDIWRRNTTTVSLDEEKTVPLEIHKIRDNQVSEEDKTDNNLILIGGPVANNLTAELVTSGRSRVNWEESNGEIEVLEDVFQFERHIIIVAGKDRWATQRAAVALSAML